MRPISFLLIFLAISTAVFATFTVNANKNKKTRLTTVYFSNNSGTWSISASKPIFDDAGVTNQATIILDDCTDAPLYKNSNLTGPVKLVP